MFSYNIISTIEVTDYSDAIKVGDILYQGASDVVCTTDAVAELRGYDVLHGLCGGDAFNEACSSAVVVVVGTIS